jgi:CII-binding regulator of phage lambda lysogenization HflD
MESMTGASSQKRIALATAQQQQAELAKQKQQAENQEITSLQDVLDADTNRLLRVFGQRSLMAGGGMRAPVLGVGT